MAGVAVRGLLLGAALMFSVAAIASGFFPPLAQRIPAEEMRAWAVRLAVPHVVADLRAGETTAPGIRRIRLDTAASFRVSDVSDLDTASSAYIDGEPARFQEFEPVEPLAAGRVVFKRNLRGGSLFVRCSPTAPCTRLAVIAHRARLTWALRIAAQPPRMIVLATVLLLFAVAVSWGVRHSNPGALGAAILAFSMLQRAPAPAGGPTWADALGVAALAVLLTRPAPLAALRGAASRVRRDVSETTVNLALALCMAGLGTVEAGHQLSDGRRLSYYEQEFAPGVNLALGRGFVPFSLAELKRNPGLVSFLAGRADSPPVRLDLDAPSQAPSLVQFHRAHRYLILTVAALWKILGISHAALLGPWCLTVGLVAAAAFVFSLTYLGRAGAVVATVAFLYAPSTLSMVAFPRDFLKAPFIFLFLAAAGRCTLEADPGRRAAIWAAVAGLSLGIGSGFRMDVLAIAPVFAVVLLLRRAARRDVAAPALAFALSALATAGPIVFGLSGGSNTAHVALLGQSPHFDRGNDLYPTENQWNAMEGYKDERVIALSRVAAAARGAKPPRLGTAPYDRVVGRVLSEQSRWAPGDLAARLTQTHAMLWELPVSPWSEPKGTPRVLGGLRSMGRRFAGWIWIVALLAALCDRSGRAPLLLGALMVAVGTSWLQLASRHVFHWLPVALALQLSAAGWLASALVSAVREKRLPSIGTWRTAAAIAAFFLPTLILDLARDRQSTIRRDLGRQLLSAPRIGVAPDPASLAEGDLRFPTALAPPTAGTAGYSLLTVDWSRCPRPSVDVTWGPADEGQRDHYRLISGPATEPGPTYLAHLRAFLEAPTYFFVPSAFAACVTVASPSFDADLPLLWSIVLAPGWERSDQNLRLADEGRSLEAAYSPLSLQPSSDGPSLRIVSGGGMAQGEWNTTGERRGSRIDYREEGVRALVVWSPAIVAERAGRYRFEFEIQAPGSEWRASADDPVRPASLTETAVGEGSLAHPVAFLLRPFRLNRHVILDEWLEAGESRKLYLRALSASGSVSVSGFRVSGSLPARTPNPAIIQE
ncbi:MAG: hypothetical protein K1Y01_15290 [Vicinamibacteria bacterium]|nr:hypothetical protein [Vicinamibacteria bacterium]